MDWRVALLKRLGYQPTKQNLSFLESWQRWEGGHTNNDASYNWLNTTKKAPGAVRSINSVGVKAFDSFDSGIKATVATLKNGRYTDVLAALASGDPYRNAPTAGLQTWVSGSPTGNPGYAEKVLGRKVDGKTVAPSRATPVASAAAPKADAAKAWDYAMSLIWDDDPEMANLMQSLAPAKRDAIFQQKGIVAEGGSLQAVPVGKGRIGELISSAQAQLGKPYVFGSGPSTESFDCSDLVQWAYSQIGVKIPRVTQDQIRAGREVKGQGYKPGDLIFPHKGHVVMYVGNGQVIAAPYTGTVVQYQPVSRFKNPLSVRRIIG
jgi:cell wall-associated NlpC family hydrolase